jgi:hypothetical protein
MSKYIYKWIDNKQTSVHILIAQKILGRKLKYGERVHHVDYDKSNNANDNLVICPNELYHKLLHARTDAYNETGDVNKRRCVFCKKHDDIENMGKKKKANTYYHKKCANYDDALRRLK